MAKIDPQSCPTAISGGVVRPAIHSLATDNPAIADVFAEPQTIPTSPLR